MYYNDLQVDYHEERCEPAKDTKLDEMVLDEGLRRTAAQAENYHILEIA